jgi:hypothetical protein
MRLRKIESVPDFEAERFLGLTMLEQVPQSDNLNILTLHYNIKWSNNLLEDQSCPQLYNCRADSTPKLSYSGLLSLGLLLSLLITIYSKDSSESKFSMRSSRPKT